MSGIHGYTSDVRKDGFAPYLGMAIALGAWTMLFGSVFFVYSVLRIQAVDWYLPGLLEMPFKYALVNTFIILLSSWMYYKAVKTLRAADIQGFIRNIGRTFILGLIFLVMQAGLWFMLTEHGLTVQSGIAGALFYSLTGLHALHIIGGLIAVACIFIKGRKGIINPEEDVSVNLVGYFWHFLSVVWVAMFFIIFIIR